MANVLNKTTFKYLTSVNTPDYPTSDWVHNPDLSAVQGISKEYWAIDAYGDVVEMSQSEKDDVDGYNIDNLMSVKFRAIDNRTMELIDVGFIFDGYLFSLSTAAQSRLMGIDQIRNDVAVVYPIRWNSKDDMDVYEINDADEMHDFYLTAVGTYRVHVDNATNIKDQVRAAVTKADIDTVVDNR